MQTFLLRNSGTAFVPNPLIYGPCRRFLDIENPNAPQHPLFKEDTRTGLLIKLSGQEKAAQSTSQSSPTKRKANKATGKKTGGKPVRKLQTPREMSLKLRSNRRRTKAQKRTMICRQRWRSSSHRHQNDKTKSTHHLQPQQESQRETDRRP